MQDKYACPNRYGWLLLPLALLAGVLAFLDHLSQPAEYEMGRFCICGEPLEYSGGRWYCPECDL
jgi:hypothetical protein